MSASLSKTDPHAVLTANELPRVEWQNLGARGRLDTCVDSAGAIYRYASESEAEAILKNRIWRFGRPGNWTDKYENFLVQRLMIQRGSPFRGFDVFAKCFTLHHSSEPMWRLNIANPIRLRFQTRTLVDSFILARDEKGNQLPKQYIGRVRYIQPVDIRKLLDSLWSEKQKKASRLAASAMLMKRDGFRYENEIRVCLIQPKREVHKAYQTVVTEVNIEQILLNPYVPQPQARALMKRLQAIAPPGVTVRQSKFDFDPASL